MKDIKAWYDNIWFKIIKFEENKTFICLLFIIHYTRPHMISVIIHYTPPHMFFDCLYLPTESVWGLSIDLTAYMFPIIFFTLTRQDLIRIL